MSSTYNCLTWTHSKKAWVFFSYLTMEYIDHLIPFIWNKNGLLGTAESEVMILSCLSVCQN